MKPGFLVHSPKNVHSLHCSWLSWQPSEETVTGLIDLFLQQAMAQRDAVQALELSNGICIYVPQSMQLASLVSPRSVPLHGKTRSDHLSHKVKTI